MAQSEYRMKARPCKVAILMPRGGAPAAALPAVRYLSWLWGGRFGWIVPVDPAARDDRGMRWLDLHRPDVVYLNGVSVDVWRPLVGQACQPMNCAALTPHAETAPFTPFPDNLITCRPVLGLLHHETALRRR